MNRIKKITPYGIAMSAMAIALVVSLAYGVIQGRDKRNYSVFLSNVYERSFHEAVGYVAQVNSLLTKLDAVERPEQSAPLFADLWKQSAAAHNCLSALPYTASTVAETQKYLTQVSDFSYAMLLKTIDGNPLDDADRENLALVKSYAPAFSNGLTSIMNQAAVTGGIRWERLANEDNQTQHGETISNVPPEILLGSLHTIAQPFHESPGLIYDGPFSDHIQTLAPRMTEGAALITYEKGKDIVWALLADEDVQTIEFIGETPKNAKTAIPVFSYAVQLTDNAEPTLYIDITKHGGLPLWMLRNAVLEPSESRITLSAAISAADAFLRQSGFADMQFSYYEYAEASVVINYAPLESGVLLYPDLVKVKLSMVDGTIEGLEALGYIMMHGPRTLSEPRLSPTDALSCISPNLAVRSAQLTLIPMGSYREILCYEFHASKDNTEFLIYINADTGRMEQMFELVINEYGALVQ